MKINLFLLNFLALFLVEALPNPDSRIIGGIDAPVSDFPFAAAINVQTTSSKFFCGGALLRARWVLTSGHCVYNAVLFTIMLGSKTLEGADPEKVIVASSEYVLHPDFDPETIQADIGLIKLRMTVTLNDYLQNANFYVSDVAEGTPVTIIGWGQTSQYNSSLSEHLQYANVATLSNAECRIIYGNQITDEMVCVEGNFNEGTCHGDNGGPLLQTHTGRYWVVGVASFISGNGCESTDPSGFTRTTPYYKWLSSVLDGKNATV